MNDSECFCCLIIIWCVYIQLGYCIIASGCVTGITGYIICCSSRCRAAWNDHCVWDGKIWIIELNLWWRFECCLELWRCLWMGHCRGLTGWVWWKFLQGMLSLQGGDVAGPGLFQAGCQHGCRWLPLLVFWWVYQQSWLRWMKGLEVLRPLLFEQVPVHCSNKLQQHATESDFFMVPHLKAQALWWLIWFISQFEWRNYFIQHVSLWQANMLMVSLECEFDGWFTCVHWLAKAPPVCSLSQPPTLTGPAWDTWHWDSSIWNNRIFNKAKVPPKWSLSFFERSLLSFQDYEFPSSAIVPWFSEMVVKTIGDATFDPNIKYWT